MEIRLYFAIFLKLHVKEICQELLKGLHVTQPTLSKQMKGSGTRAWQKNYLSVAAPSVSLTDEGMLLRKRAEDLLALADKITNEFQAMDDITGG